MNEDIKLKRGEYIQATIKKFMTTEPKIDYHELAYLIWELEDFSILEVDKLIKELNKCKKSKI